jgi:exopolysaccharide biosynthesis protein
MIKSKKKISLLAVFLSITLNSTICFGSFNGLSAQTLGVVAPRPSLLRPSANYKLPKASNQQQKRLVKAKTKPTKKLSKSKTHRQKSKIITVKPLSEIADLMGTSNLSVGVVHKFYRGGLNVNLVDVDMNTAQVKVKPVLAANRFALDEVKNQAKRVQAIAAVNANYFKKDGTPLGSLKINGEWITGPIYERISLGITEDGSFRMDRLNLHGLLETSNPEIGSIWVNNVNQPRRSGSHLIAYTQRWGSFVQMAYPGTLIAVDHNGCVTDKTETSISIPYGGFVLSDSRDSDIAKLSRGDLVHLNWQTNPQSWEDVIDAVSGGPVLIRNNQIYIDLKGEKFRQTWTTSQIKARTAIGVTADRHLLLLTVEGPHTLWDVAKFLHKMGAIAAMNLDGGGSTTMVVNGQTVTRNRDVKARRVASSLAIIPIDKLSADTTYINDAVSYIPEESLFDFSKQTLEKNSLLSEYGLPSLRSENYNPTELSSLGSLPIPNAIIGASASTHPENSSKAGKYWHWLQKRILP